MVALASQRPCLTDEHTTWRTPPGRVKTVPFVNAATDANGWVTYTGAVGSGRVTAPLGATRFWISLAGGEVPGKRELVISAKPRVITRYTYDGSPVTESSLPVTGTLTLTRNVTLRARSFSPVCVASA